MARSRPATSRQMTDAADVLQRVLETETFALTTAERLAILDAKRALKVLAEVKEGR